MPSRLADGGHSNADERPIDAESTPRETADDGPTEEYRGRGPYRLLYPAYGPVESLVGFGLFYLLVDRLTPVVADALAGPVPALVPEPFATLVALLLWLVFGLTVGTTVLAQVRANPPTFGSANERDAFLDANRPSERDYRFNLALLVLGGSTAVLAWPTMLEVLRGLLPVVVTLDGTVPAVLTVGNVAVLVVFFLGFAAYARGLDRLVVGGMREFLYRTSADDWE